MRFHILTLFPDLFASVLSSTMLQKGQERGALEFVLHNIRDYAADKHRVTDDAPYGGGDGMVMKPEPVVAALDALDHPAPRPWRVLLSPQGRLLTQAHAATLAAHHSVALVCGRYEGVDERVRAFVDEELSIGDFVLSGGEIAALVVIDAVSRLVPGVLGNATSIAEESFSGAQRRRCQDWGDEVCTASTRRTAGPVPSAGARVELPGEQPWKALAEAGR